MSIFSKKQTTEKPVAQKPAAVSRIAKASKKKRGVSLNVKKILVRPLITEKVTDLAAKHQYVFAVHPGANKIEVANEISKIYNVTPVKVNIMNTLGKHVRFGRSFGKQKDWKKAIVILKKGETINVGKDAK